MSSLATSRSGWTCSSVACSNHFCCRAGVKACSLLMVGNVLLSMVNTSVRLSKEDRAEGALLYKLLGADCSMPLCMQGGSDFHRHQRTFWWHLVSERCSRQLLCRCSLTECPGYSRVTAMKSRSRVEDTKQRQASQPLVNHNHMSKPHIYGHENAAMHAVPMRSNRQVRKRAHLF